MQSQAMAVQRARAELLADPHRPDRVIAGLAGVTRYTVRRVRRQLIAAGLIQARGSCSPLWHVQDLPPMPPALSHGACVGHEHADWWSSRAPADRARALAVCRSACPVQALCAEWAISLGTADTSIYGGLTHAQRRAIKRQRAQATA